MVDMLNSGGFLPTSPKQLVDGRYVKLRRIVKKSKIKFNKSFKNL